jgi:hypothetical protein
MRFLLRLLCPLRPFGLFLEGMAWYEMDLAGRRVVHQPYLAPVSDPTQVGPNRSDPEHYDEMGRYLWWGC